MRFMILVKANDQSELGAPPDAEMLSEMGKFNEELIKAGVMLDANGLMASKHGKRVHFNGTKRTVISVMTASRPSDPITVPVRSNSRSAAPTKSPPK